MKAFGRERAVLSLSPAHPAAGTARLGEMLRVEMPSAAGGILDAAGQSSAPSPQPNPMAGPIHVEGIRPGDTLAIRIHEIRPVGFGRQGEVVHRPDGGRLHFLDGLSVPLAPSIGCLGVAPAMAGEAIASTDAGDCGGNLDCRDFAPGATVFLQARVPGAMVAMGDVHLAMGDGEVEGQGVEAAADGIVSFHRAASSPSPLPWLIRGGEIMGLGADADLSTAIHLAYEGFITLLENLFGLSRQAVQARIGPAGAVRICQSCCRVKSVRIALPLDLLVGPGEDALRRIMDQAGGTMPAIAP